MKIKWIGTHARGFLPIPGGGSVVYERHGEVEVDDEFGKRLVKEQPMNWEEVKKSSPKEKVSEHGDQ